MPEIGSKVKSTLVFRDRLDNVKGIGKDMIQNGIFGTLITWPWKKFSTTNAKLMRNVLNK